MSGGAELNPSGTNTIGAATDHTFTLTTTDGSKFMGFLLRLSGKNGATASSTIFGANNDLLAQVSNLCASDVIGITHKGADGKSSITITLNHPEAAALLLEVTVVTTNQINWSYDAFDLLVSGDATATASPTVQTQNQSRIQDYKYVILAVSNAMITGALFLASFVII